MIIERDVAIFAFCHVAAFAAYNLTGIAPAIEKYYRLIAAFNASFKFLL